MTEPDLNLCALHNRSVFDEVLAPYVTAKLEQVASRHSRGMRAGWFDASGCAWCLFDDERFARVGDAGRRLRDQQGENYPFQVYWSMGDVLMPRMCDARWVAERIATESMRQLSARGFRCVEEEREVDGETHLGVRFRKGWLGR